MHQNNRSVADCKVKKIVVTGAAGRIGYHLLFLLAQGNLLGLHQHIALFLLEKECNLQKSQSIKMELEDALFPLVHQIECTHNLDYGFSEADYVFLCGAKICKDSLDRKLVQEENWRALEKQGISINRVCTQDTLFLMIANPCNTNALVLSKAAPNIPPTNIHALVRLDQNRTQQFIARKIGLSHEHVNHVIVWGNHSNTIVPDCSYANTRGSLLTCQLESQWLYGDLIRSVQERGRQITCTSQGLSSCGSAAHAAIEAMKALLTPTPTNSFFCTGMYSQGNPFGFDDDLVISLPCRTIHPGKYEILKEYPPHHALWPLIRLSEQELLEERARFLQAKK